VAKPYQRPRIGIFQILAASNPCATIEETDAALKNNGFEPLTAFEKDLMLESPDAHAMLSAIQAEFLAKHGFKSMKQARRRLHCTEAEVNARAMVEFSSMIGGVAD
jgi:hypothetical protein